MNKKEKLVVTTTNKNKIERISKFLRNENFEVFSLSDVVKDNIKEPEEYADTAKK